MNKPLRQLSLLDCTGIIVGIIVGAGIFQTTPLIASSIGNPLAVPIVWLVGGLIALLGASCYAELVTTYPEAGGDLVFLTRAYGKSTGMLFAWCDFWIVRPGNIGAMAFVFARYGKQLFNLGTAHDELLLAGLAVGCLTLVNLWGAKPTTRTQNVLMVVKILGLGCVILIGLFGPTSVPTSGAGPLIFSTTTTGGSGMTWTGLYLAMVLVLFTYGGWNEISYVAAEIRHPERNITRALVGGMIGVIAIYLLANWAFLRSMGYDGLVGSSAIAADVVRRPFGEVGARLVSLLIAISCLGAINGMIMTGSRIYYALGSQDATFSPLGKWNGIRNAPVLSLLVQGCVGIGLLVFFGRDEAGFENLVILTTPVYWSFLLLVAASLVVMRLRDPAVERPYRAPFYPLFPVLFCLSCAFLVYASLSYALSEDVRDATRRSAELNFTILVLLSGLVLVVWTKFRESWSTVG